MSWFDAFAYGPLDLAKGIRLPPMIATLRTAGVFFGGMTSPLWSCPSHCNLLGSRLDCDVTQTAREATDG